MAAQQSFCARNPWRQLPQDAAPVSPESEVAEAQASDDPPERGEEPVGDTTYIAVDGISASDVPDALREEIERDVATKLLTAGLSVESVRFSKDQQIVEVLDDAISNKQ